MNQNDVPLGKLADAPAASAIGAMQDPTKPPRPPVDKRLTGRRMLTVALLLPLFMLLVMPLLMTGMTSDVEPRDMKVAVIGSGQETNDLADSLEEQSAGGFEVSVVADADEASDQVREQEIRAAYDPSDVSLRLAGASGRQVTGAVTQLFDSVAQQDGQQLSTEDLLPLEDEDPAGSASIYLALGVILGGFMSGIILSLMPTGSTVRLVLGLVMPAVFATGMIVYGWAVFGIFSGVAIVPWLMMYLLSLTALSVTSGLMLALGPVALPIAILLIPMIGMSSSGVSAPLDMVGGFYGAMHTWVFSAQGIGAVRDALYFEDTSLMVPTLVMLGWLVAGIGLAALGTVRQKRRHLFAQLSAREETTTALAAGAAAV